MTLFCRSHRFQPLGAFIVVVGLLAAIVGLSRDVLEPWQQQSSADAKRITTPALQPSAKPTFTPAKTNQRSLDRSKKQVTAAQPQTESLAEQSRSELGSKQNPLTTDPDEFVAFYTNNNGLQANRLLQPYRGKWIKVSGNVQHVNGSDESAVVSIESDKRNLIAMMFERQLDQLAMLKNGQRIAVIGKIEHATPYSLALAECELVHETSEARAN